jgi:hypothetical protein
MKDAQAYKMIGKRAAEMALDPNIQAEMMALVEKGWSKERVESWLYLNAVGTLCGFCMTSEELAGYKA